MKKESFWIALVLSAVLGSSVLRLLMISVPFERDEGAYAYIADRWLAGEPPYRDAVDSKPPGIFAAYALALAANRSVESVRALLIPLSALATALLFLLARKRFGLRAAAVAAALFPLTQAAPAYFGFSANAEIFMAVFVIAAILVLDSEQSTGLPRSLACGALLGVAILFKPVAATDGLPVFWLIVSTSAPARKKIQSLLAVGVGVILALAACWAVFSAMGVGKPMLYWAFEYNAGYTAGLPLAQRAKNFLYQILMRHMLARDYAILSLAVIGAFLSIRENEKRREIVFPILWFFSAFVGVSASGRFTPHYFQQMIAPACLLAGIGFDVVMKRFEAMEGSAILKKSFGAAALALLLVYPTLYQLPLVLKGPALSRTLFGLNPFMEGEEVGRYLAERTNPDETIFILGSEPQFLFHAKRKSATKFLFTAPLMGTHPRAIDFQKEAIDELATHRPRYVIGLNIVSSLVTEKATNLYIFDRFKEILLGSYTREASLYAVSKTETRLVSADHAPTGPSILDIYRRKD